MVRLQHWLLQFGAASMGLRHIVGEFGDWMVNGYPPWAAYREMMAGRLINPDKCPVVQPFRVGKNWCRMLAKCVLAVAGAGAKEACSMEQLCGGLEAGIEGGIHASRLLWQKHAQEEEWAFILVDA